MTEKKTDEADIFNVARKIDAPEARAEYLNLACGGDAQLRSRIEQLLQALARQPEFLSSPPSEIAPTVDQSPIEHVAKPGNRIGPYRLLEKIGEGGMGTVFMANQERPLQRRVALKIIKPGRESEGTMARFEAERQALAMMDHPHIARVLDAGTTEDDRPYFVMELVKGIPITKYCDDHRLSLNDRLKLFLDVCNAVQHAHQKGVIHRDLKPTNILVAEYDDKAVPKVIDFGLAKALGQQLTEKTMFTGFGEIMGTLEYMSPEQAKFNQLDIDTRSDIYSLGVLLYELVTGSTPFDQSRLRKAALDEAVRIIRDEEPPRPSLRLSSIATLADIAAQRRIEPGKLRSLVRGELDWIVMKTLDKERTRRYQTSAALADDVHRYLTDQRVTARPPTTGYLMQKFVRRNRMAITVAIALLITFLVGFAATVYSLNLATINWKTAIFNLNLKIEAERKLEDRNEDLERERSLLQETTAQLRVTNETLRQQRYSSDMTTAQDAFQRGEVKQARMLLERNRTLPGEADLRGIEWDYLWNLTSENESVEEIEFASNTAAIAVSSSGKYLAVAQSNRVFSVLDAVSRKRVIDSIATSAPSPGWGSHVEFSRQGERLAYIDASRESLRLLDIVSKDEVEIEVGAPIKNFAFSPKGDVVASVTNDEIQLHSTLDGTFVNSVGVEKSPNNRIAFTQDNSCLVECGDGIPGLLVWKLDGNNKTLLFPGHEPSARTLAVSSDGEFIATGGYDNKVILWNAKSGSFEHIATLKGHKNAIHGLAFSPMSDQLVSSSRDTTIRIWNTHTMNAVAEMRGKHFQPVYDVAYINNGKTLVSSGDKRLCFWQVDRIKPLRILRTRKDVAMRFANDDELVYSSGKAVHRLRIDKFKDEKLFDTNSPINGRVCLSLSGVIALRGKASKSVEFWGKVSEQYALMKTLEIEGTVGQIEYSAAIGKFLVGTTSGLLVIEPDGSKVDARYFPDRSCRAIAVRGDLAAILFNGGEILIWNALARASVRSVPTVFPLIIIPRLEFSNDGKELVLTSTTEGIALIDVPSGNVLISLSDVGQQWSATFANGDRQILSLGDDGCVTVRDKFTLASKFAFPSFDVTGQEVAVSPSGKWLAARSLVTGEIRVWDVHSNR